ncbi:MAG: hypothetical protein K2J70_04430 [Muribaculaceae bacterium]|nr:hypothetical protein [Muribaculaceae bacterium]
MKSRYFKGVPAAAALLALVIGFSGCKKSEFKVKGEIYGASDKSVLLEKPDFHGRWIAVDSARTDSRGGFAIEAARPSAPEVYRLAFDGRYIYLPVDSTETLTVTTSADKFGHEFNVTGTPQAERMSAFEKELLALDFNDSTKRADFKREVYSRYLKDAQGGLISYYVLTKTVGDKPLYDLSDPADAKYYAAVATAFSQYRPDDPHAGMLREASIEAMRRRNTGAGKKRVMEAEEIKLIDIALNDESGREVKLSNTVGKGKKGVMIVSMMNEKESPALNKALADLYDAKGGGVAFYMVSLDRDLYAWREAARNLPWTTVADPEGRNSGILVKYNIGSLPAYFIFNSDGELIDRASNLEELRSKL